MARNVIGCPSRKKNVIGCPPRDLARPNNEIKRTKKLVGLVVLKAYDINITVRRSCMLGGIYCITKTSKMKLD